jgi:hypothetical protein
VIAFFLWLRYTCAHFSFLEADVRMGSGPGGAASIAHGCVVVPSALIGRVVNIEVASDLEGEESRGGGLHPDRAYSLCYIWVKDGVDGLRSGAEAARKLRLASFGSSGAPAAALSSCPEPSDHAEIRSAVSSREAMPPLSSSPSGEVYRAVLGFKHSMFNAVDADQVCNYMSILFFNQYIMNYEPCRNSFFFLACARPCIYIFQVVYSLAGRLEFRTLKERRRKRSRKYTRGQTVALNTKVRLKEGEGATGESDSTVAINAAIDAARASGGVSAVEEFYRQFYFDKFGYKFDAEIDFPSFDATPNSPSCLEARAIVASTRSSLDFGDENSKRLCPPTLYIDADENDLPEVDYDSTLSDYDSGDNSNNCHTLSNSNVPFVSWVSRSSITISVLPILSSHPTVAPGGWYLNIMLLPKGDAPPT